MMLQILKYLGVGANNDRRGVSPTNIQKHFVILQMALKVSKEALTIQKLDKSLPH